MGRHCILTNYSVQQQLQSHDYFMLRVYLDFFSKYKLGTPVRPNKILITSILWTISYGGYAKKHII